MSVAYERWGVTVYHGDCLDVLPTITDASVHAVVCDPPYELAFMGRQWDASGIAFNVDVWRECLRVLKPGGHLLAFGGSRTWHRLAVAVEDAGFELRDSIAWLYGNGFPKSLDVSKAIDKTRDDRDDMLRVTTWLSEQAEARGITRADVDTHMGTSDMGGWWLSRLRHRCQVPRWEQWLQLRELIGFGDEMDAEVWRLNGRKGAPGEAWEQREVIGQRTTGIGTGRGSVAYIVDSDNRDITAPATPAAQQWNGWGTALKPGFEPIVVARKPLAGTVAANVLAHGTGALNIDGCRVGTEQSTNNTGGATGRWPSNVALDAAAAHELDQQSGTLTSGANPNRRLGDKFRDAYGEFAGQETCAPARSADSGGASRFFPVFRWEAKAPTSERPRVNGIAHPTVKPIDLMRWLVRLVTPPDGIVLDPFLGSGTTAQAARAEGFRCIGIERDDQYLDLIRARLDATPRTDATGTAEPSAPLDLFDLLDGDAA